MPRSTLTARFVETVTVENRTDFWDDKVRSLVLRVSPSGVKTWNLVYTREADGKKQRYKIGRFPIISLVDARARATAHMGNIVAGGDPAGTRREKRDAMAVKELGALYIEKHAKPNKRTWQEDERFLKREVYPKIGDTKILSLKRADIREIIDAKVDDGKAPTARLILAVVRKMMNWAVEKELMEVSPANGIKVGGKNTRRDRVLSKEELAQVIKAIPEAALANETRQVLMMLIYTGQRSGEVCGMRRREVNVDEATWTIPGERTKNGLKHVVPLSEPALAIVSGALAEADDELSAPLFSRVGEPIETRSIAQATRKALQLFEERWTPHDLRRTVATSMAGIGIHPHVVEACLNHISGFRSGVAGTYNRAQYEPEKREALEKWSKYLILLH